MTKSVAVVSGGLDSVTMLYLLRKHIGGYIHVISFDYGQRHKKELEFAEYHADQCADDFDIIDLTGITTLLGKSGSSLVSNEDVPEGHYAADNMKATVVPNRNMIMASIAGGVAVADDAEILALGVHSGDHFIYPDCRPEFIERFEQTIKTGNEGFIHPEFTVHTPFLESTKTDIARFAGELEVPFEKTWSCYKGGEIHCGKCGTCVERLEAIAEAKMDYKDFTAYEDPNYWRTTVGAEA